MPQFLIDPTSGGQAYLQSGNGWAYPYDRQANSLWEPASHVTGQCNTQFDGLDTVCDPYFGYSFWIPSYHTTFYGLNTPEKMQLLAERLGGLDNMTIVYSSGVLDYPYPEDYQELGYRVGPPSQSAPYWRNGKAVTAEGLLIKGPGDTTVPTFSANPQNIWYDEDGNKVEMGFVYSDTGKIADRTTGDALGEWDDPNDGQPSVFDVQQMRKAGFLRHVPIVAYTESQDAVIRSFTGIELPPGFITDFGPQEAEAAAAETEAKLSSGLLIVALSPVELTLTDNQGRRLGYDAPTGEDLFEIPDGSYFREEDTGHKSLFIFSPEAAEQNLTLTGVGSGEYTLLGYYGDDQAVVNLFVITGTTTIGQIDTLTVTVPAAAAELPYPPQVRAGDDITAYINQPVSFAGEFADINPNETHTVAWDFGDGQIATGTLTPPHTFVQEGVFTVTLTVTDSLEIAEQDTLLVTVSPAFQEVDGQVVIEVEQIAQYAGWVNRGWYTQTALAGYSGEGYLSALPDIDRLFTMVYTNSSLELQYGINFTTTGLYYVWLRGYVPNAAGDSVYVGVDNQVAGSLSGFAPRRWDWVNNSAQPVTINIIEPGMHTFHLWQREDGLRLDQIVLTTDNTYSPPEE